MRNYRSLQVWEKAHMLTLAIYRVDARFSKRRAIRLNQPDPALGRLDRARTWRRDVVEGQTGRWHDLFKFPWVRRSELSYHLLLARDLDFLRSQLIQARQRFERSYANAIVTIAKSEKYRGSLEVSS